MDKELPGQKEALGLIEEIIDRRDEEATPSAHRPRSRSSLTQKPSKETPVDITSYSSQLDGWTEEKQGREPAVEGGSGETDGAGEKGTAAPRDAGRSKRASVGPASSAGDSNATGEKKKGANAEKKGGEGEKKSASAEKKGGAGDKKSGGAGEDGQKKPKPKTSKAERRALQEAQRAAKAAKKEAAGTQSRPKGGKARGPKGETVAAAFPASSGKGFNQLDLFSHLEQYKKGSSLALEIGASTDLHPHILRLGLKYADGSITGSNARAVALLHALREVIQDYTTPKNKSLDRDLEISIRPFIAFLKRCRPLAIGMGNAINYVKYHISQTSGMAEAEAKAHLIYQIDRFLEGRVAAADKLIAEQGASKINDCDVVLTYACSHVVKMVLKRAYEDGKRFRVIVVDSHHGREGRKMLAELVSTGIECTYVLFNAVSYIMREVTKVFVGASAMLANGSVVSRTGTAGVAMMAHSRNLPVMVCCETYKFCDRAQLDSIVFNELGNPQELVPEESEAATPACPQHVLDALRGHASNPCLNVLNLMYDLTPLDFIAAVLTDVGMIPPTSVPVVLREYNRDLPMAV